MYKFVEASGTNLKWRGGICSSVRPNSTVIYTFTALRYKPAFMATYYIVGFLCGGSRVRSSAGAKDD